MRRKLKLLMLSLAAAVALFAAYYVLNRDARLPDSKIAAVPRVPMPSTLQDRVVVRGMGLLAAEEVWFDQRDENGELRFQFRTERADPQGETITLLSRPEIRIFGGDGQIIDLRGDTGRVEHDNLGPDQAKWKQVELTGNVEIEIDRRGQLTDVPLSQRPVDRIQVNLEELRFDQELATIRSNGQVDFYSREADVFGDGLKITLNELNREIEKLAIHQGRRMIIRGVGNVLARSGPIKVADRIAETDDPAVAAPRTIVNRGEIHTYKTTFHDNVKIVQGEFVITADRLDLLYDILSEGDIPGVDPEDEYAELPPGDRGIGQAQGGAEQSDDEITITWSGSLVMVPQRGQETAAVQSHRRFEVTATGERVVIASDQGEAVCQTLVYKDPEGRGSLSGQGGQPVRLLNADGMIMSGSRLHFNQAGVVIMDGPGHIAGASMPDRESDIPVGEVSFSKHARFHFASLDGAGKRYLDHARFQGDVVMATPTGRLNAYIIDTRFVRLSDGSNPILEQLEAIGDRELATLSQGDDRLQAQRLSLMLAPDSTGQSRPQLLNAEGEVMAQQRQQSIVADAMIFTFSTLPGETASEHGNRLADVVLIEATGAVEFKDPQRELTAVGDRMVSFPQRRTGYIQSTDNNQPAHVVTRDGNRLVGLRIYMDQEREHVTIAGPGNARYQSERQMDGSASDEPVPIDVKWSESMSYDGRRSQLRLIGNVKAVSQRNQLAGNLMRLQFDRKAQVEEVATELSDEQASLVAGFVSRIVVSDRARLLVIDDEGSTEKGISSRAFIASEELIIDLAEERLEVPVAGKILLEDYRAASPQSTGRRTGLAGGDAVDGLKPSVTRVDWGRQMVFYYGQGRHLFDGNVKLRRWTADSASLIVQALQNLEGEGEGLDGVVQSVLVSRRLELVYQQQREDAAGRSRYLGGLALLNASGGARLDDVRASIEAERIGYRAADGLYTALGSAGQAAHLQWHDGQSGEYASLNAMNIRYFSHKGEYQLEGFRGRVQASTK